MSDYSLVSDEFARLAFNAWCERAGMTADDPDAPHAEAYFAGYQDGRLAPLSAAVPESSEQA